VTSSDSSLVRRFQRGEEDAATALYLRYANRLGRLADKRTGGDLAARFDSDDVVQSVFRTFFRRVAGGAYDVPDGDELWGLLMVITLNKVRLVASRHRAAKRSVDATKGVDPDALLRLSSGDDEGAMRLLRMTVDEYLAGIDPADRQILELRIEGYGVAEVAERSGRTKRTVERVLQRLREGLRGQVDA
jgi:RNA polymerase sigma-70 factor (ECF subfamily)